MGKGAQRERCLAWGMQTRLSQSPYTRDKVEERSNQKSKKDLWALPRACVSGASRQESGQSKALRHRRRQVNESTRTARVPTAVLNNLPPVPEPIPLQGYRISIRGSRLSIR